MSERVPFIRIEIQFLSFSSIAARLNGLLRRAVSSPLDIQCSRPPYNGTIPVTNPQSLARPISSLQFVENFRMVSRPNVGTFQYLKGR